MAPNTQPRMVVDLLKKFIGEQASLGGTFDTPEAFYDAMADFLAHPPARKAVAGAWIGHMVEEAISDGQFIPHEEVFAELQRHAEQRLAVQMREETQGISSDEQAIAIIVAHIRNIHDAITGVQFDTFEESTFMHRIVERVVQVCATAVQILPLSITGKLDASDLQRLNDMKGRLPTIGEPLSPAELWEAVSGILPRMEAALTEPNHGLRPVKNRPAT